MKVATDFETILASVRETSLGGRFMAMEPITLFARAHEPAQVAAWIREICPDAQFVENDTSWSEVILREGVGSPRKSLTITHDPEYYSEPNWSKQMDGMRGYFSRFPENEHQQMVLMLTTTFRFSLGLLFDPDDNTEHDLRLDWIHQLADRMDAVFFTPSSLQDSQGRVLYNSEGDSSLDAKWPMVLTQVDLGTGDSCVDWNPNSSCDPVEDAPTAERVARRALALAAVTARAILEQNPAFLDPIQGGGFLPWRWVRNTYLKHFGWGKPSIELIRWAEVLNLQSEMEPDEWETLCTPLGKLPLQVQTNATWRLEGLVVLAWALGKCEIPPHDELVAFYPMWRNLGLLNVDDARALIAQPILRPREEIRLLRARLFSLHWRLQQYRVRPAVMDFPEFAKTCEFGPLDISGWPMNGGDLQIRGSRIDRAPRHLIGEVHSITMERHLAVNWLWGGPHVYSETQVNT